MIIDTELHVFVREPYTSWGGSKYPMVQSFTWCEHSGDLAIDEMNEAGVDKAVLISYTCLDLRWWLESVADASVEDFIGGEKYTLRFAKKYPDRFIWFKTVDPLAQHEGYVEGIKQQIRDEGLRGMKFFPGLSPDQYAINDSRVIQLLQVCSKLDLPVIFSFERIDRSTRARPGRYTPIDYMQQLTEVVDQFPELRISLVHLGGGLPQMLPLEPALKLAKDNDNIWLSSANYLIPGKDGEFEYPFYPFLDLMRKVVGVVGAEKIMWATDWPWTESISKYKQLVTSVKNHATFLSDKEKELFLGENAARWLRL